MQVVILATLRLLLAMIKGLLKILSSIILLAGISHSAQAQFINLRFKIEPELSATVEHNLDFGTQIVNSGHIEVNLGDINMGVFSVKAFHTQNVFLDLQYPAALVNNTTETDAEIPIDLKMAYNNSGINIVENASPLSTNNGYVSIHERTELLGQKSIWQILYIYVYGAIDIGNIPNGLYTGDIILSVSYD